jgi:hypothetical protein
MSIREVGVDVDRGITVVENGGNDGVMGRDEIVDLAERKEGIGTEVLG